MKIRKFAAIDIGSNGVRLLICNVIEKSGGATQFQKSSLVRIPIRLGQDVFVKQIISQKNAKRLQKAMIAYKNIMEINDVEHYKCCATSAMREAKNSFKICQDIYDKSGVKIEIIRGTEEASIIANNHLGNILKKEKHYLFVDVGGGSTELTLYKGTIKLSSSSFKIGTVRLINNIVARHIWEEMKRYISQETLDKNISVIGSGGNINKVFKLSRRNPNLPITYAYMLNFKRKMNTMSYEDKITILKMNEDRADVIPHAMKIYTLIMKWSKAKLIYAPKIGLSDGIVKNLYKKVREQEST